jgi:hypothetical protein
MYLLQDKENPQSGKNNWEKNKPQKNNQKYSKTKPEYLKKIQLAWLGLGANIQTQSK